MIDIDMMHFNMHVKIKCKSYDGKGINNHDFLSRIQELVHRLDLYETVEVEITKGNQDLVVNDPLLSPVFSYSVDNMASGYSTDTIVAPGMDTITLVDTPAPTVHFNEEWPWEPKKP